MKHRPRVTIVDLGISNLHSVANALRTLGADVSIAMHGKEIIEPRRLLLPGVGAFPEGMNRLRDRGFITPLRQAQRCGTPILGICLGMQLLFTDGAEFAPFEGLGMLDGHVRAIPKPALRPSPVKVPHVGWDKVNVRSQRGLFAHIDDSFHAYFLHSYRALPTNRSHEWATCSYGPHEICAVAGKRNVMGTQFHPEKSGPAGLQILQNFLEYTVEQFAGVTGSFNAEEVKNARHQVSGVRAP